MARKLAALRALFRFAQALGVVDRNPARPELVHAGRRRKHYQGTDGGGGPATADAITGDDLATWDRALELALRTGLRRAELMTPTAPTSAPNARYRADGDLQGGKRQSVRCRRRRTPWTCIWRRARTTSRRCL